MTRRLFILLLALFGLAVPAAAAAQAPSAELRARADEVVAMLRGGGEPAEMFTPEFLAQIPEPQVRAVASQIAALII